MMLTGSCLRRLLLPDQLPHRFLEVFGDFLHAVESPSVLEGVAEQFLFRFPPGNEITIHTRVPTTNGLRHTNPPSPRFTPRGVYWILPGVAGFPETRRNINHFRSRAHRDRVNAKGMKDPRLSGMDPQSMPFDCKRMVYGGFKVLVDV